MKFKLRAFNFSISFLSTYLLLTFSVIENSLMPLIFQIFEIDIVFKLVLATFVSIVFLILNEINHKISTNNEYIHLFEFLIFLTSLFSIFYMVRLFSLSRLFIIFSSFTFLTLNALNKTKILKQLDKYRFITLSLIFLFLFSFLTFVNLNSSRNAEVAGIEESIDTSEVTTETDSDRDIYLEIENNYKKHENLFTGTYSLNNIYNLKKFKICCEEYSYFEYSQKSSGAIATSNGKLYHVSGNLIVQKFELDELFDSTTNLSSKIIPTNINSFIKNRNIFENNWESLKDMFISDNKIYLSYLEENSKDCLNVQIISADISSEPLVFKPVFKDDQCVMRTNENFNAHQGGGKMLNLDKNHILLSVGDFRQYELAQNNESIFGKIIQIDIRNGNYEIISIGNRNPQGLIKLKNNDKYILESEHGPKGGDEINIISLDEVKNYGWPISSYGVHYDGKTKELAPLHKSHLDYGFEEPLHYFPYEIVKSHGISDLEQNYFVDNNNYFISTLNGRKIYDIEISNDLESLASITEIRIGERIRNIIYNHDYNSYILLLEDTPSIAVFTNKE